MKIQLGKKEATYDSDIEGSTKVLLDRFGLQPRKKDGLAKMHSLVLELYERKKQANREKKPELAVMPVEDMSIFAGIKRQTMYDHLRRWLDLNILKKTSFVSNGKVVIGYELNGTNLEAAFRKAEVVIRNHIDESFKLVSHIQNEIKKDKIRSNLGP